MTSFKDEKIGITAKSHSKKGDKFLNKLQKSYQREQKVKNKIYSTLSQKGIVIVHRLDGNVKVEDSYPSKDEAQKLSLKCLCPKFIDYRTPIEEGDLAALEKYSNQVWRYRIGRITKMEKDIFYLEMLYKMKFNKDGNKIR